MMGASPVCWNYTVALETAHWLLKRVQQGVLIAFIEVCVRVLCRRSKMQHVVRV